MSRYRTHCKYCYKKLIFKNAKSGCKKMFCNQACNSKWHNKNNEDRIYNNIPSKKEKYTMRTCLGVYCRGKKMFRSSSISNRQCPRCLGQIQGCLTVVEVNVMGNGRS